MFQENLVLCVSKGRGIVRAPGPAHFTSCGRGSQPDLGGGRGEAYEDSISYLTDVRVNLLDVSFKERRIWHPILE